MYHTYYSAALMLHELLAGDDYDMLPAYYVDLKKNPIMDLTPERTMHQILSIMYPDSDEKVYHKDMSKNVYLTACDILLQLDRVCEEYPIESACRPVTFTVDASIQPDCPYVSDIHTIMIAEYVPYAFQKFSKNMRDGMNTSNTNAKVLLFIGS